LLRHKSKALEALKKYNEAIECLDKIIEIFPVCYNSYENKGLLLNNLQKYDEAISCFVWIKQSDYSQIIQRHMVVKELS
jgi:tetratricopeptide (TPR) repeat protein